MYHLSSKLYFLFGFWIFCLYIRCLQVAGLRIANLSSRKSQRLYISKLAPVDASDFPILSKITHMGKKIVYLDSAATTHMPNSVRRAIIDYWDSCHSNVNRGSHSLSSCATEKYEDGRNSVKELINAGSSEEIVFTSGATHAINLVALGWAARHLSSSDDIMTTVMEHHSNFLPWQRVATETKSELQIIKLLSNDQTLDLENLLDRLSPKTKLVCVTHISNVIGSKNNIERIIKAAHNVGALVLVDACQSIAHVPIDVQELNVDFLVASGHKMFGPTGVGFLYAKQSLLESMSPVFLGGGVVDSADLRTYQLLKSPYRFEAGTPPIAEVVGLSSACNYLKLIGVQNVHDYCKHLGQYLYDGLSRIEGLTLYGPSKRDSGIVSFTHGSIHPSDIAAILDLEGVCVRSGLHCAHPLHANIAGGSKGSIRASAFAYNTVQDIDVFLEKLELAIKRFTRS